VFHIDGAMSVNAKWMIVGPVMLVSGSCRVAGTQLQVHPQPPPASNEVGQGSVITLRTIPPADSVVLRRGNAVILFSMQDVQARWAESEAPLPRDLAQFRDDIQAEYDSAGWVALDAGFLEDLLAARLIAGGRAVIRMEPEGRLLPWVRMTVVLSATGSTMADDRVFHAPDGTLLLRVPYRITVS
jgi:hypothetical protein